MITDWSIYPNFTKAEFDCKHTGKNFMQPEFMNKLQAMRTDYGKSMIITSGYRDITHPTEASKKAPGQHNRGLAADVACDAGTAHEIVRLAMKHGFTGIGISQRNGLPRFVHLDIRSTAPVVYSY